MFRPVIAPFLCLVLLAGAACDGSEDEPFPVRPAPGAPEPSVSDTRVIGLVGTLSGPDSWRGEDAFEGADLALQLLNRDLNRDQQPFELIALDDEGRRARAIELVERIAQDERSIGVIYAGPPEGLPEAERELAAAGIPAVLCYGDLYGARQLSAHLFQTSPSLVWEARRLGAYIVRDRRYRTVGLIAERSLTGRTARGSLRRALQGTGARLSVETYAPHANDVTPLLERLRRRRVEALVVQADPGLVASTLEGLSSIGASYRTTRAARIASAPRRLRRERLRAGWWRPQVMSFDLGISSRTGEVPPGLVASDTYARGVHYLPIPSFKSFRSAFAAWWDSPPLGWEHRAYEAAMMIGWAARRAEPGRDLATTLEGLTRRRFGGLDVTLGPDDHTSVDQRDVGLWVVPRPGAGTGTRSPLPWEPLARGFSIDGDTTDIAARDWAYLFRNPPPPRGPAPKVARQKVGVATPRSDPVH